MAEPTSRCVTGYYTIYGNLDGYGKELYIPAMNVLIHYGKAKHPQSMERLDILTEDLRRLFTLRGEYWNSCWTSQKDYTVEGAEAYIEEKTKNFGCFHTLKISYEKAKEVDNLISAYESNVEPPNTYGLFDTPEKGVRRNELDAEIKRVVSINIPAANYL